MVKNLFTIAIFWIIFAFYSTIYSIWLLGVESHGIFYDVAKFFTIAWVIFLILTIIISLMLFKEKKIIFKWARGITVVLIINWAFSSISNIPMWLKGLWIITVKRGVMDPVFNILHYVLLTIAMIIGLYFFFLNKSFKESFEEQP
jgi:hypothetical protein